jgi:chromosomal replication initiation ATPase DnaA
MTDKIINTVLEYYDIKREYLFSNKTTYDIVHARKIAMYFLRVKTTMKLSSIGLLFKRTDCTVSNLIKPIFESKNKYIKRQLVEIEYLIDKK